MKPRGFTLVEVLVALAILSLVLVALLRMEVSSISLAATSSITLRALMVGTRELDELERTSFSGDLEEEIEPFFIKARTEQTSQKGLPIEKTSLEVFYADKRYTELILFKIKI